MIRDLSGAERDLICAVAVPIIYLILAALGRRLKRREGVHLGVTYQLFAILFSFYLPLQILDLPGAFPPFEARRELGAASVLLGAVVVIALIRHYVWTI